LALLSSSRSHVHERPAPRVLRLPSLGILAASGLVAGAALMPVVQTSNATTTGYENRRMEARKTDIQAAIYNAQTEIAQLGSLERIDKEARGRLGMVPADRSTIVTVQEAAPEQRQVPARFLPQPQEQQQQAERRGGLRALLSRLSIR
jgi:hypothetical protein